MSQTYPPQPVAFKDRRGGLIFFGIVQIVLGMLAGLMAGLVAVSSLMLPTGDFAWLFYMRRFFYRRPALAA